ncbi:hypothetical protein CEXT_222551 [Caerostris extrusa]|uniref:Uncharacterized protein n=1 Tax=Caerostris extrusa TaxID=172846 RepID=A0AAV4V8X9_CAEEX|nr:hypothetical protein CEXT_222551 [Caerostris extrusa]
MGISVHFIAKNALWLLSLLYRYLQRPQKPLILKKIDDFKNRVATDIVIDIRSWHQRNIAWLMTFKYSCPSFTMSPAAMNSKSVDIALLFGPLPSFSIHLALGPEAFIAKDVNHCAA